MSGSTFRVSSWWATGWTTPSGTGRCHTWACCDRTCTPADPAGPPAGTGPTGRRSTASGVTVYLRMTGVPTRGTPASRRSTPARVTVLRIRRGRAYCARQQDGTYPFLSPAGGLDLPGDWRRDRAEPAVHRRLQLQEGRHLGHAPAAQLGQRQECAARGQGADRQPGPEVPAQRRQQDPGAG